MRHCLFKFLIATPWPEGWFAGRARTHGYYTSALPDSIFKRVGLDIILLVRDGNIRKVFYFLMINAVFFYEIFIGGHVRSRVVEDLPGPFFTGQNSICVNIEIKILTNPISLG